LIKKITQITDDGYIYIELHQFNPGTTYYFKISSYDTSFNESNLSNMKSCTVYSDEYMNVYRCTGNFATGIVLDEDNTEGGSPLDTWGTFPYTLPFVLTPCSLYQSGYLYNPDGLTLISWKGIGDNNDIQFQYRTANSSAAWSSWSTLINAIGNNQVNFNDNKYAQFRFIFRSSLWTDSDNFIIKELY
jgi:hypothetical protein